MTKSVVLTRRELDLMSVIWRRGDATVEEVLHGLGEDLAYPTVLTILRILEQKGFLRHERDGRAFRYYPLVAADEAADGILKRVITKVYRGSRELLLSRLIADESVSEDELRRLRKLVNDRLEHMGSK